jgi:hypothetical protein
MKTERERESMVRAKQGCIYIRSKRTYNIYIYIIYRKQITRRKEAEAEEENASSRKECGKTERQKDRKTAPGRPRV